MAVAPRRHDLAPVQWLGSVVIGLLVPAAWLLTGWIGYLPEHPQTLEAAWQGTQSRRPETLSVTAPIAHTLDLLTFWSDQNATASFGVMLAAGVLAGSTLSARWRGEFKLESFGSAHELRSHLVGGLLMGLEGAP
ncbi:MAG TPA: YeeE/YedE thiosulfate transporter family protein [Methylibium sp.]|nr:YeeE/YedE thiosulfate transporter family protein [Methylibium sp.]